MTIIKKLNTLPRIEVTVPLYEISSPMEETRDEQGNIISAKYYSQFQYGGSDITIDEGNNSVNIGAVTSPFTGGSFVRFNMHLLGEKHQRQFFLTPDDLWYLVAKAAGIDVDKLEKAASEKLKLATKKSDSKKKSRGNTKRKIEPSAIEDTESIPPDKIETKPALAGSVRYDTESSIIGGNLEDVPQPHIWYFASGNAPRKRRVTFRIMRYYGIGTHYFVSLREEDDYVWDASEDKYKPGVPVGWRKPWDAGEGRHEYDFVPDPLVSNLHVDTYHEAKTICNAIIAKYFPNHEVEWQDYTEHFEKEGD